MEHHIFVLTCTLVQNEGTPGLDRQKLHSAFCKQVDETPVATLVQLPELKQVTYTVLC